MLGWIWRLSLFCVLNSLPLGKSGERFFDNVPKNIRGEGTRRWWSYARWPGNIHRSFEPFSEVRTRFFVRTIPRRAQKKRSKASSLKHARSYVPNGNHLCHESISAMSTRQSARYSGLCELSWLAARGLSYSASRNRKSILPLSNISLVYLDMAYRRRSKPAVKVSKIIRWVSAYVYCTCPLYSTNRWPPSAHKMSHRCLTLPLPFVLP